MNLPFLRMDQYGIKIIPADRVYIASQFYKDEKEGPPPLLVKSAKIKKIHRRILVIPEGSILRGLVSSGDVIYKDNELLEELKTYPQKRKNRN